MPSNVKRFELLGYIAAAIGVLYTWYGGLDWAYSGSLADTIAGISYRMPMLEAQGLAFSFFFISALLVWLGARRRQSWAIWALLLLFLVDLYFPIQSFVGTMSVIMRIASVVQIVLPPVALYFAFTPEARVWFSRPRPAQAGANHQ